MVLDLSIWAKALALRLVGENVTVLEVRPGIIKTDMSSGAADQLDALITGGLVPARRWGDVGDVGEAVAAAVSGAFDFSTGTVINVDGGHSLQFKGTARV